MRNRPRPDFRFVNGIALRHRFWKSDAPIPVPGLHGGGPLKCVFLDRDGTLIDDAGYLSRTDRIRVRDGVFEGVRRLLRADFVPVVVTNQSGVARGLIDERALREIHRVLHERFFEREAPILDWYYCPHLPSGQLRPEEKEGAEESLLTECGCRKPENGLWTEVLNNLPRPVELAASWSVGDRPRDVMPGLDLGTNGILLTEDSGRPGEKEDMRTSGSFPDAVDAILDGNADEAVRGRET